MTLLSELDLRARETNEWCVLAPFRAQLDALGGRVVSVPKGFVTDLASVPRLPFVYWSVGGRARRAAGIHDYLYQTHGDGIDRGQADAVFLEVAATEEGAILARLMWAGIRVGGVWAWHTGPRRFRRFANHLLERRTRVMRWPERGHDSR